MRTLFFDLDETLAIEHDAITACFAATWSELPSGTGVDAVTLTAAVRRRARELWRAWEHYTDFCVPVGVSSWEGLTGSFAGDGEYLPQLRQFVPDYRIEAWRRGLCDCGIQDVALAARLAECLIMERKQRHSLFPDAQPCVDQVRRHWRLGLITNGVSVIQRGKLKLTGLDGQFDPVLVSGEVGVGKPDARIFRRAMELAACTPEECVMVGDAPERDITGACGVGWRAVWLNRYGKPLPADIVPDATITTLAELPSLLERWG